MKSDEYDSGDDHYGRLSERQQEDVDTIAEFIMRGQMEREHDGEWITAEQTAGDLMDVPGPTLVDTVQTICWDCNELTDFVQYCFSEEKREKAIRRARMVEHDHRERRGHDVPPYPE